MGRGNRETDENREEERDRKSDNKRDRQTGTGIEKQRLIMKSY